MPRPVANAMERGTNPRKRPPPGGALGLPQKCRDLLTRNRLLEALPRIDELETAPLYQHFCGHRAGVVPVSHGVTVGSSAHEGDQLAFPYFLELPVFRETVTALADGTHNVRHQRSS